MTPAGPPADGSVVGGRVLAQPVLVRRDDLMAVVRDLVVYPSGLAVDVETVHRDGPPPGAPHLVVAAGGWRAGAAHVGSEATGRARMDRFWVDEPPPEGDLTLVASWAGDRSGDGAVAVVGARQMAEARARIIA